MKREELVGRKAYRLLDAGAILVECANDFRLAQREADAQWAWRVARNIGKRSEALMKNGHALCDEDEAA